MKSLLTIWAVTLVVLLVVFTYIYIQIGEMVQTSMASEPADYSYIQTYNPQKTIDISQLQGGQK
jgi:ABC-type dipeptide/oligopeptide/nickel transport system permease component